MDLWFNSWTPFLVELANMKSIEKICTDMFEMKDVEPDWVARTEFSSPNVGVQLFYLEINLKTQGC